MYLKSFYQKRKNCKKLSEEILDEDEDTDNDDDGEEENDRQRAVNTPLLKSYKTHSKKNSKPM